MHKDLHHVLSQMKFCKYSLPNRHNFQCTFVNGPSPRDLFAAVCSWKRGRECNFPGSSVKASHFSSRRIIWFISTVSASYQKCALDIWGQRHIVHLHSQRQRQRQRQKQRQPAIKSAFSIFGAKAYCTLKINTLKLKSLIGVWYGQAWLRVMVMRVMGWWWWWQRFGWWWWWWLHVKKVSATLAGP